MSASVHENERHVYPRWRSFQATSALGELASPATQNEIDPRSLDESLAHGVVDWEGDPSLWHGLDLLGTAMVAGRLQEFSALVAKIRDDPRTPRGAREILGAALSPGDTDSELSPCDDLSEASARTEVRNSRRRVALSPRDAIEWVELARAFTITGQREKSRKAITAALQLAPSNRFVLRSAARFFLHEGEKERALSILSKSPTIRVDPWILASELAISDSLGRSSKFFKLAREKAQSGDPPPDLTELVAELGTQEAENGNHRIARKFLRQSLVGANENSIAQIGWLNRHCLGETVDTSHANPPLLHEAKAWASLYVNDFETAQDESVRWLIDQPFASAPAQLGSYIAADILLDFRTGMEIAKAGLRSNPDDPGLLNNLAYSLMELGKLDEAETAIARARQDDNRLQLEPAFAATRGMLAFKKGNTSEGRMLYLEAIEKAKKAGSRRTAARAAFHLAYEELIAGTAETGNAIGRMKEFEDQRDVAELAGFFERVNKMLKKIGKRSSPNGD